MIVRTREMTISANIFDFTARKFFRMDYNSHDKLLRLHIAIVSTLVATNTKKWVASVSGFCSCSVFTCALLLFLQSS